MQKVRIKYAKEKELKFIGHLDLLRLWERILRRTNLPVAYSQGFNPKPSVSFGPPLPLGFTSECELIDITFDGWIAPEKIKNELNCKTPNGLRIIDLSVIAPHEKSTVATIEKAEYLIEDENGTISSLILPCSPKGTSRPDKVIPNARRYHRLKFFFVIN